RSWSHFTLVSPLRNHSSSANTDRVCTFFVVTRGKPAARSKRAWWPKTLSVPVPVRSVFSTPSSRMRRTRSRYACTRTFLRVERHRAVDLAVGLQQHDLVDPGVGQLGEELPEPRLGVRLAGERLGQFLGHLDLCARAVEQAPAPGLLLRLAGLREERGAVGKHGPSLRRPPPAGPGVPSGASHGSAAVTAPHPRPTAPPRATQQLLWSPMSLRLVGTGAADGWPTPFCACASCSAERASGRVRAQAAALLDCEVLLDCGPSTPLAAERLGISLAGVRLLLWTHQHSDHFSPATLMYRA